jgi:hypothetical protein
VPYTRLRTRPDHKRTPASVSRECRPRAEAARTQLALSPFFSVVPSTLLSRCVLSL